MDTMLRPGPRLQDELKDCDEEGKTALGSQKMPRAHLALVRSGESEGSCMLRKASFPRKNAK